MNDFRNDLSDPVQSDEYERLMAGFGRILKEEEPRDAGVVMTAFVMSLVLALETLIDNPQERAVALTQLLALVRRVAS